MRIGFNPHKDKPLPKSEYLHQVIIPVYIPHHEGYFKDSFAILKLCLQSLFKTIHKKTWVTLINNGSCAEVMTYLEQFFQSNEIHELIHTSNIGKLNAILKGLAGNQIPLVTISDADVLFLSDWQTETNAVFSHLPKAGVVGIVPQFTLYKNHCGNVLFDYFWNPKLKFLPVKNKEGLIQFYDSIGRDKNYNKHYLDYILGIEVNPKFKVVVGSGHFVATYRKDIFEIMVSYLGYALGGDSEKYLDEIPLKKDYWRVTTYDNYAHHMGNTLEKWMSELVEKQDTTNLEGVPFSFKNQKVVSKRLYLIKNYLFYKLLKKKKIHKLFLRWKGLPLEIMDSY